MFAVLQLSGALRLPVPGPVVVVVLSVILSAAFDFQGMGIAVVGDIPSVLPSLSLPFASGLPIDRLLLGAAAVFLVSFAAGIVTARSFGARGGYPVDADREMVGFGAANIARGPVRRFPGHRFRFADGDQRQRRRQVAARRHRGGRGTAR